MNQEAFFELMDKSTAEALELAHSLSPAQLSYAKPGRWSAMQILEHICMAETSIGNIMSRSSDQISEHSELVGLDKVHKMVVEDRQRTVVAPDRMVPKGTITSVAEFEKIFTEQRNTLKHDLLSRTKIIDNRVFKHPALGEMTITDWMYFPIKHTERHLEQIRENIKEMGE